MDDGCADLWDEGLPRDAGPLVFLLTPLLVLQRCSSHNPTFLLFILSHFTRKPSSQNDTRRIKTAGGWQIWQAAATHCWLQPPAARPARPPASSAIVGEVSGRYEYTRSHRVVLCLAARAPHAARRRHRAVVAPGARARQTNPGRLSIRGRSPGWLEWQGGLIPHRAVQAAPILPHSPALPLTRAHCWHQSQSTCLPNSKEDTQHIVWGPNRALQPPIPSFLPPASFQSQPRFPAARHHLPLLASPTDAPSASSLESTVSQY